MNSVAVAEAIQLALAGVSLLRTLGATSAEIKLLMEDDDQSQEELLAKLTSRQNEIESRIEN